MRGSSVKNVFGVPCVGSGGRCVCSPFHCNDQTRIDVRWALATREGRYGCADTRYAEDALTELPLMEPANGSRQSILARHLRGRDLLWEQTRNAMADQRSREYHSPYLNSLAVYYAPSPQLLPGVNNADRL